MPYHPLLHHRRSIGLEGYDYAQPGAYFVTICTRWRRPLFGSIRAGVMQCNQSGEIVARCWHDIAAHFANVSLDAYIVMPDHVHGIIVIEEGHGAIEGKRERATLGQMVAFWKYQAAKQIDTLGYLPGTQVWQRNYYERILRDTKEIDVMRRYIVTNAIHS